MRPTVDTIEYQLKRQELVEELRKKGIHDQKVLGAISNIPRHFFMDEEQWQSAYIDKAFPIGEGQTISQPYTVAYQTQLLDIEVLDKVLEIGTGSGYQAAVLAEMGAKVYTIERIKNLFDRNRHFDYLRQYKNIQFFYGDGYDGLPHYAPFDKILITAAAPEIPPQLIDQLRIGGILVMPFGEPGTVQRMMRFTKAENGGLDKELFDLFSFVPMLKGKN
jgi:protein-L-isoaspartate(D-aspartate) O-methyltransferase